MAFLISCCRNRCMRSIVRSRPCFCGSMVQHQATRAELERRLAHQPVHEGLLMRTACLQQRKALEAIARSRRSGVLRAELAHQLGIEPKNFHYIVRVRARATQQARYTARSQHVGGRGSRPVMVHHAPRNRVYHVADFSQRPAWLAVLGSRMQLSCVPGVS